MLDIPEASYVLLPVGVTYLMLHVLALLHVRFVPTVEIGTSTGFFVTEVVLFLGYILLCTGIWQAPVARWVAISHMAFHASFAVMNYFDHAFLVRSVLLTAADRPRVLFCAKELGLAYDAFCHALMVSFVATSFVESPGAGIMLATLGVTAAWVTSNAYVTIWRGSEA